MPKKIRVRERCGYSKEAGGHAAWVEYQVVDGRKIVGRYELLSHATKAHPDAWVPPEHSL
jgi:hypothetical protein